MSDIRTPEVRRIMGVPEPPPPDPDAPPIPDPPAAVQVGRFDYPLLLAHALREERWTPVQVLLTGSVECRSPELDTAVALDQQYEVRHKEVRAALELLSDGDRSAARSYLRAEAGHVMDEAGRWQIVPPALLSHHVTAFEALWHGLCEQGWVHAPT